MTISALMIALATASATAAATAATTPPPAAPAMLPDRLLTCTLGRATNIDTKKNQTIGEIIYEGSHPFALFLPSVPVRTTPPPDATDPPEPVDPATRIVADPGGLARDVPAGFDRAVDLWPERVELARTVQGPLVNLIIVSDIDVGKATANLFMTQATDVATFNMKGIYQGGCTVVTGPAARAGIDR
jgi:hypothetical protein